MLGTFDVRCSSVGDGLGRGGGVNVAAEGRSSQVGAERELSGDEWEEKGVSRRVGNKVIAERRQSGGRAKARRRQSGREEETILLKKWG